MLNDEVEESVVAIRYFFRNEVGCLTGSEPTANNRRLLFKATLISALNFIQKHFCSIKVAKQTKPSKIIHLLGYKI